MNRFRLTASCNAIVQQGDITVVEVDAIVNAANEMMLGGGGVDGAIHHRAGPGLVKACREIPEVRPGVRCPRGEARVTPGFELPCDYVIHTVGPVYRSADESGPVLASAFRSCLRLATDRGVSTIAFPAISCGIYGYPLAEAAQIAVDVCREPADAFELVRFVLYGDADFKRWLSIAEKLLSPC